MDRRPFAVKFLNNFVLKLQRLIVLTELWVDDKLTPETHAVKKLYTVSQGDGVAQQESQWDIDHLCRSDLSILTNREMDEHAWLSPSQLPFPAP